MKHLVPKFSVLTVALGTMVAISSVTGLSAREGLAAEAGKAPAPKGLGDPGALTSLRVEPNIDSK